MAKLLGTAFCFMLPSLAATAGIEAWRDDSALLQVEPAMTSVKAGSLKEKVVALRSLVDVFKDAAQKHNDSLADSTEFYMSTVAPQMENASNFIMNTLATLSATKESNKKSKSTLTWITSLIDSVILWYEYQTVGNVAQKCSPLVVIVWWVMGLITMTKDQGLTVPEALDMLTQQFTSVGYGSSNQSTDALKIFHGLHGVVSQMTVNRVMSELYADALNSLEKNWAKDQKRSPDIMTAGMNLLSMGALTTFVFAIDLGAGTGDKFKLLDGIYQTLITMTTIGYGDMSPKTPFAETISPLTLPFLTTAFSRWNDAAGPEAAEKNAEVAKDKSPIDAEICQCFGKKVCFALPTEFPPWPTLPPLPSLPSLPNLPKVTLPSLPSLPDKIPLPDPAMMWTAWSKK